VIIELLLLYFNNNSIGHIIGSMIIAFALVNLALFIWLLFCYKRDKIALTLNLDKEK
jgi:hypothetical protein